jgi:hypothetical protein
MKEKKKRGAAGQLGEEGSLTKELRENVAGTTITRMSGSWEWLGLYI